MWCNTLLSVVWWTASWADDEQYKGKNSLPRRGVLVVGGCEAKDGMAPIQDEVDPQLWWWLVLFIEALVLSPNIEREGANNGQFERGQLVQVILTKAVFAYQRLWW